MAGQGLHIAPRTSGENKIGAELKQALRRSQARQRRRALALILPLLVFVVVTFVVPIGQLLMQSFYNPGFSSNAPKIAEWFAKHPSSEQPSDAAYAALTADLRAMHKQRTAGMAGTRINYEFPGAQSMFSSAAKKADALTPPFHDALTDIDARWADAALWQAMRSASSAISTDFYLKAVDLGRDASGKIMRLPEDQRIHGMLFLRTLYLSLLVTLICLVIAYPVAHLLARLPSAQSNLLMILVLLPFWTSLLVRTTSWVVLLQTNGVINDLLVALGVIGDDQRLALIYNKIGTIIAMTHILLPFMILPLYSVMRGIPPTYARAARSLGATSWTTFRRIYLPQTLPGISAGGLLVFIMAVGYYITPALVGGASGQMISNMIAFHMQKSLNWSLAAALAGLLLAGILALYWVYDRLVGIDNMKLG